MITIIISIFVLFSSYIFASSASLISEKSGTANISIEGNMIMGAILFIMFQKILSDSTTNETLLVILPIFSIILAAIFGTIFSLLFAVVVINALGNQIITGTGINLLAPALAVFIGYLTFGKADSATVVLTPQLSSGWLQWLYPILFVVMAILLFILILFIMRKTKTGLSLRAAGENPLALETSGTSVSSFRFIVLLCAGGLSAIAGAMWVFVQGNFIYTVFGAGFMAVGIVIFSQWKIERIIFGSLIIAILTAFTQNYLLIPALENLDGWAIFILKALPYIIPLIILLIAKKSGGPSSLGKPFKKEQR